MKPAATIVILVLAVLPSSADTLTLALDGKATATIVIPDKAPVPIATAAADLQRYVKLICGVELPIHRDGKRVPGSGLYIGPCEVSVEGLEPGLNPETYAIRVRRNDVFFQGRTATPAAFAVYSFLEDNLGVRWFAPGGLWEYWPRSREGELVVDVSDVVKTPDTSPRIWSGHAWNDSWKAWNLRNKTVMSEIIPRRQFQNNLYRVFPPSKYGQTHPEYYPLIDGKRWIPASDSDPYWRPCESNPDVLRLTAQYARRWFDEHPTVDSFSVGMDDISHLCSCPNCRAMDAHPDSYEKKQFSDRHYRFVNALAREVKKTHPDRYIGTLIYAIARELPECVDKLEDNVFGFITETSAAWWMEGRKEADHSITREWAKRCKHLSRYDYYGFASIVPRFYPHHMDEQIKFDKSLGLEGMYTEVYTFLPHTAPMIWALAKLQWDHTLSIDDLLGEFYAKMYGPAAPVMKEYLDLLERSYNVPRPERGAWEHRNLTNQALAMSPEDVDAGLVLLQKGINSTGDPDVQERIAIHKAALQYGGYAVKTLGLSRRLEALAVNDEASAEKALRLTQELNALGADRAAFWAEAGKRDDLLGETIRGLDGMDYIVRGQVANLERGGMSGALKSLAWYSRNAPDRLAEASRKLQEAGGGPIAEMVRAWLWVAEAKPESLVKNGDFEDLGENTQPAEKDWKTEGAPRGWSVWASIPETRFEVLGGKGQGDSAAASISRSRSSCYLQTVPAKPGEKYLVVAWARSDPPGSRGVPYLGVRFRDDKGAWHPRRDLEPSVQAAEGIADWQPLVLLVTIPEGAASFLVMPGAKVQAEGARALFDGVGAWRVASDE